MARQALVVLDEAAQLRLVHTGIRPQSLLQFPFLQTAPLQYLVEGRYAQIEQQVGRAEQAVPVGGQEIIDAAPPDPLRIFPLFQFVDRIGQFLLRLRRAVIAPTFEQYDIGSNRHPGPCRGRVTLVGGLVEAGQFHRGLRPGLFQGGKHLHRQVDIVGTGHAAGRKQGVYAPGPFQSLRSQVVEIIEGEHHRGERKFLSQQSCQKIGQGGLAAALRAVDADPERAVFSLPFLCDGFRQRQIA